MRTEAVLTAIGRFSPVPISHWMQGKICTNLHGRFLGVRDAFILLDLLCVCIPLSDCEYSLLEKKYVNIEYWYQAFVLFHRQEETHKNACSRKQKNVKKAS
jgi:hypothetical protein